jgi:hypothetical protein
MEMEEQMANNNRGDDATAAAKLAGSKPMAPSGARADETPRRSSLEKLRPGQDPTAAINRLYAEGRSYPREQPARSQSRPAVNKDPLLSASPEDGVAGNFSGPQMAEDQPALNRNYFSDASGWVRACKSGSPTGSNEDAMAGKGNFDYSKPRNKMRR